jgi:hypothetical protein
MSFRLHNASRQYFSDIMTTSGKVEDNKLIMFDAYYLCLLVGLSKRQIDSDASTLDVIFNDSYPDKYVDSRDYIAGLLIATEAERKGIEKDNATALQQLMLNYVDYESPTRLSKMGVDMLNQYSSKGMDIIRSSISRPTHIEDFLREYFLLFQTGEFE